MAYSSGSERMKEFWEGYVKPSPAEAKHRLEERKLNAERLPWVVRFDIARPCESRAGGRNRKCKNDALWAYTDQFVRDEPRFLRVVCWTHLTYGHLGMGMSELTDEWYTAHGWQVLGGDVRPYRNEVVDDADVPPVP